MKLTKASVATPYRVITLMGAKGTGKTTTACSISKNSPDTFPHKGGLVDCSDVVFIQTDTGGVEGAIDSGMDPMVLDLSREASWPAWELEFNKAYKDLHALCAEKKLTAVAIDLTALDKLLRDEFISKAQTDSPKNWETVTSKARSVFLALATLPNVHVIGMVHPTVQAEIVSRDNKVKDLERLEATRTATSYDGERQLVTPDLAKGFQAIWKNNCAAFISLQPKTVKLANGQGTKVRQYQAYLASANNVEAGSRWFNRLGPGPHYPNLRVLLEKLNTPQVA